MVTPSSNFLLSLYRHYKAGVLPHAGGLLDQPHYYTEAMEILAGLDVQIQAEAAQRMRESLGNRSLH